MTAREGRKYWGNGLDWPPGPPQEDEIDWLWIGMIGVFAFYTVAIFGAGVCVGKLWL